MRVYELARDLGVKSADLVGHAETLGIHVTPQSNVTDDVKLKLEAVVALEGKVSSFDARTGKGQVTVSKGGRESHLFFDLKSTRLENTKYSPIRAGKAVRVKMEGPSVGSITVDP
jgi:hypothetical protein